MKYKVGDKVRVRKDILTNKWYGRWVFAEGMCHLIGGVVSINEVLGDSYHIDEDICYITDEMLEDVEEYKKEDVKFEVGKWYKYSAEYINHKTYAKYSSNQSVSGRFYYDEIITENNGFKKGHNWSILTCNPVLLTDLSEIQQYLPENHPDKIKRKTKKVEDLKYPDAVHCSSKEQHDKVKQFANIRDYDGNYYYLIGAGGRREKPWDGTCGSNPESRTTYTNYEFSAIIFPEEKVETKSKLSKEELLAEAKRRYPVGTKYKCANGILSPGAEECFEITHGDELKFFDDSNQKIDAIGRWFVYYNGNWAEMVSGPTVEEEVIDIPEYIECIEGFSDYIIPGLIYKVIDKTHVDSIILRCNITSNLSAGSNLYVSAWLFAFKPSTKEAFDKQGKSGVKEKEELVQTGLSQSQACDSCKYYGEECAKRKGCDATGGQHYPKDDLSERYIVAVDPFDSESYSDGTEVGKFLSNKGMGFYEQMEKMCMQTYSPMGLISGLYYIPAVPKDCFESDEIYVPIIKTEVKQIKL